ncbi:MAG: hypothetical protein ACK4ON_14040, partial [Bacteroidia bacterium]
FNYVLTSTPYLADLTLGSAFTLPTTRTLLVNPSTTLKLGANMVNNGAITQSGSMYLSNYVVSGTGSFVNNVATSFLYIGHADGISTTGAVGNIQS